MKYNTVSYSEFISKNPDEQEKINRFSLLLDTPFPVDLKSQTIKIAYISPGIQMSDFWTRNIRTIESRLRELNGQVTIKSFSEDIENFDEFFFTAVNDALNWDPDYLILTCRNQGQWEMLETLSKRLSPKVIVLSITTPVTNFEKHPLLYAGFSHEEGSKMIAEYYKKRFPKKANFLYLCFKNDPYLNLKRGESFLQEISPEHNIIDRIELQGSREEAYAVLKNYFRDNPNLQIDYIYSASTDISLGASDAINTLDLDIMINGWGGGTLELEAIKKKRLCMTPFRIHDDCPLAMAMAIALNTTGREKEIPQVFSGNYEEVTQLTKRVKFNDVERRSYRYSYDRTKRKAELLQERTARVIVLFALVSSVVSLAIWIPSYPLYYKVPFFCFSFSLLTYLMAKNVIKSCFQHRILSDYIEQVIHNPYQNNTSPEFSDIGRALQMTLLRLQNTNKKLKDEVKKRTIAESDLRHVNNQLKERINIGNIELERERMKVEQASKMATIGEMASNIAHEINNPTFIIKMCANLIKRELSGGEKNLEVVEEKTTKIENSVERIGKIISGLKNFARDGSQDPFEDIKVRKLIYDTLELLHKDQIYKEIEIKVTCPDDYTVFVRPVQISQVLLNLINNSIDAISSLNQKWIHINVIQRNEMIDISIRDSGHGIPKEIQDRILLPFFTTKKRGRGTGLGLSISNGIITAHDGTITLDKTDRHTHFIVSLPSYEEEEIEDHQ